MTGEKDLFAEYVNQFLKKKVQSSELPSWCKTEADLALVALYTKQFLEREGVDLTDRGFEVNPGLRYLSKLMLNSFWGKFGQRENQTQTSVISQSHDVFKLLTDPSVEVQNLLVISDDVLLATWNWYEESCTPLNTVNVVNAAYTTANARLELYKYLEPLGKRIYLRDIRK